MSKDPTTKAVKRKKENELTRELITSNFGIKPRRGGRPPKEKKRRIKVTALENFNFIKFIDEVKEVEDNLFRTVTKGKRLII